MKLKLFALFLGLTTLAWTAPLAGMAENTTSEVETEAVLTQHDTHDEATDEHDEAHVDAHGDEHADGHDAHASHGKEPAMWSVIPFVVLLLMIATGPLFYAHFWHKNYPIIAIALGAITVVYYLFVLHDTHHPIHSLAEYVSFIALLAALFVASGGILIKVDKKGTPLANIALLVIGAAIANVIGTTGASMLLIRPFMRLNKGRLKPYHIVFFIFMVSNVGGSLTPIGDPPLFLGFLKGIPFEWTIVHVWEQWIFGISLLSLFFYFFDKRNKETSDENATYTGKIKVIGASNVIFLAITIGAVFLDPNVMSWVPGISYHGQQFSFIREIIMLTVAFVSFKAANKEALKGNEFTFEPIREVAFLFIGIFATMMPALQLIGNFAKSTAGQKAITADSLYWMTGALSGVLDNAPTYLNFLSAAVSKVGGDVGNKADIATFVDHTTTAGADSYGYLLAISVAAVFFGAFTYIGNAPNFMVKSIAEASGVKMPSFMGYVVRYSIPILLPVLAATWLFNKLFFW